MTISDKILRQKQDFDDVYGAGIRKMIEQPITELMLPDSTKSIRPYCFYKCDGLESVDFPPMMQTVNESAFEACNGITSLIIPTGLNIGKKAFANMASLETVHFSGKAKSIHPLAFASSNITDIYTVWNEGEVSGAPWGANNATIHYAVTNFVSIIYDNSNPLSITSKQIIDGIIHAPRTGSFKTVDNALVWERGDADTYILSTLGSVATMYSDRINYDVVISRNGDKEPTLLRLELRSKYKTDGTIFLDKSLVVSQWEMNESGEVIFKPTGEVITTITNEPTHIRTSVDFRLGTISYCDENFNPIKTGTFSVDTASGASSVNEWRRCFKNELFRLYSRPYGDSIRIHSIEVSEGAVEYTLLPNECFRAGSVSGENYQNSMWGIVNYYGTSPTVIIPKELSEEIRCINNYVFDNGNIEGGQVFLPSTIRRLAAYTFREGGFKEIFVPWSEGEDKVNPAPWGAANATIHYDYDTDVFYK